MTHFHLALSAEELHQLFTTNGKLVPSILQSFSIQLLQKLATEQIQVEPYERTMNVPLIATAAMKDSSQRVWGALSCVFHACVMVYSLPSFLSGTNVMRKNLFWLSWKWWYRVFQLGK